MKMREKMARAMYVRYCACGELMMTKVQAPAFEDIDPLLRFQLDQYVDAALDALMQPTPSVWREAMKDYESERPLHPEHGIKSAGQLPSWVLVETSWKALIRAIKEGK